MKTQNCIWFACAVALLFHTGCVPIPIFTEPSSTRVETPKHYQQDAPSLKSNKVTHPHRFGAGTRLIKAFKKRRNGIEIVDSREICQVALPKHDPDADILLGELLMEDVRNRILSRGIRFLVVVGRPKSVSIDDDCRFWPCGTSEETTTLESTLIDIKDNTILEGFSISSSGKGGGILLVLIYPAIVPDTYQAVVDTMAERIAERISEKTGGRPTRIMVFDMLWGYDPLSPPDKE